MKMQPVHLTLLHQVDQEPVHLPHQQYVKNVQKSSFFNLFIKKTGVLLIWIIWQRDEQEQDLDRR